MTSAIIASGIGEATSCRRCCCVMPMVPMVMVNFYLESSAIFQATNGEVADNALQHCPANGISAPTAV